MSRQKKTMKAEAPKGDAEMLDALAKRAQLKRTEAEVIETPRPNYKDLARSILDHVAKEYPQLGPLQFRLVVAGMKHAKAEGRYWADITRKSE